LVIIPAEDERGKIQSSPTSFIEVKSVHRPESHHREPLTTLKHKGNTLLNEIPLGLSRIGKLIDLQNGFFQKLFLIPSKIREEPSNLAPGSD